MKKSHVSRGFTRTNFSLQNLRGFTLMELIVTVTLVLLMTGLFIAGYNGFNGQQTVIQAAATLKVNLSRVRTQASGGLKPAGCDQLVGYQVDFLSDTTYASRARCFVGGSEELIGFTQTWTLPFGVKFSPIPQTTLFYPLDRGVSVPEVITLKSYNKTVSIQVLASGSVADYAEPTPTPTP